MKDDIDYVQMPESEFLDRRIAMLRKVLLERTPGVVSVSMNGTSVTYLSVESELRELMAKQSALNSGQNNLFVDMDLSGAY